MKNKLFTTASIIAILASSAAYAKTEGHSAGFNLIQSQYSSKPTQPAKDVTVFIRNSYGAGLNYKYAFNMDGMFVAPGVYANYNNIGNKNAGSKYGYGVRADLGYDINDKVAPYLVVGLGRVNVKSLELSDTSRAKSFNRNTLLMGAGVKVAIADNMDLSFEYTTQKFDLSNKKSKDSAKAALKYSNRIQAVQFGVAYKF